MQNIDYEWNFHFSKKGMYLQKFPMVLHLLLFSWHFANIT